MATLELGLSALICLYNLLVPEIQKHVDEDQLQPDLVTLLDETNKALGPLTGETAWFVCPVPDCDHRPFMLTPRQLADAEGVISCDVCGRLCHRVSEEKPQRSLL